jgi:hypothetical protein
MKATDARKLTNKHLKGPAIQPYLVKIYEAVDSAARNGRNSITNPLYTNGINIPSHLHEAVEAALRLDGYTITNHPDPDPGHPCSGAYTTLSW